MLQLPVTLSLWSVPDAAQEFPAPTMIPDGLGKPIVSAWAGSGLGCRRSSGRSSSTFLLAAYDSSSPIVSSNHVSRPGSGSFPYSCFCSLFFGLKQICFQFQALQNHNLAINICDLIGGLCIMLKKFLPALLQGIGLGHTGAPKILLNSGPACDVDKTRYRPPP
jgi:hypothetical protein